MEPNEVFLAEVEEENQQLDDDPDYLEWLSRLDGNRRAALETFRSGYRFLDSLAVSLDTCPLNSEAVVRGREAVQFAKMGCTNAARHSAQMAARIYFNAAGRHNCALILDENEEVPF